MRRSSAVATSLKALALAVFSSACAEGVSTDRIAAPELAEDWVVSGINGVDQSYCTDLLAGQTTDAGDVCIDVTGEALSITYTTVDGWELTEAHFWAGTSQEGYPQARNGNPKVGNFPCASGDITGATSHTFTVTFAELGIDPSAACTVDAQELIYMMAHAAVRKDNGSGTFQTETGWGNGRRVVERGSWATMFSVELTCQGVVEPPCTDCVGTETAFAFGGNEATCFLTIDEDNDGQGDFNRWGWTNGPIEAGEYTWPVYAGAGQCSLTKGTLVGSLSVNYDGSTLTAIWTMDSGFFMDEAHLYAGSAILASNNGSFTVAPGQYPFVAEFSATTSYTASISNLSGPVYVVAHSVTGEF